MPYSKAKQAEVADRRAQLVKLRLAGVKFDDPRILNLGYSSRQAASKDMIRALEEHREEEAAAVSAYRQQENERLDGELERLESLEAAAHTVLRNRHIMVNNGRVILHPDTNEPMEDDAPVLQAIDRLVKIEDARRRNGERRAKLNGLDMPVKAEVTGADGGPLQLGPATTAELETLIGLGSTAPPSAVDDAEGTEDDARDG
jgi:hypothetical protein